MNGIVWPLISLPQNCFLTQTFSLYIFRGLRSSNFQQLSLGSLYATTSWVYMLSPACLTTSSGYLRPYTNSSCLVWVLITRHSCCWFYKELQRLCFLHLPLVAWSYDTSHVCRWYNHYRQWHNLNRWFENAYTTIWGERILVHHLISWALKLPTLPKGTMVRLQKYVSDLLTHACLTCDRAANTPIKLNQKLYPTDGVPLPNPTRYC